MKILFAYFGQPRYVYDNMPNHIVLMKQLQNTLVSYDGVDIDILFATTPMDDNTVSQIETIIPNDMTAKFDFISELGRAHIASSIHSKLKSDYFDKHSILTMAHQIISIHMLASKIDKEYDAVYVLRTDLLFLTHETDFNFSFLQYDIPNGELNRSLYVTDCLYRISGKMPSIHVADRTFLTNSSVLKKLFATDFEDNLVAYFDDSYAIWGEDAMYQIEGYHSICVRFLSNSFNSRKLRESGDYYLVKERRMVPLNSMTRKSYTDVQQIDIKKMNSIIDHTIEFDKTKSASYIPPQGWENN